MARKASVYRMYDEDDRLLYIGASSETLGRFRAHASNPEYDWYEDVRTIKIEKHPTMRDALEAERAAIQAESPVYNVSEYGVGRPEIKKTQDQIDHARLIWTSNQFESNADAFKELQRYGWTRWLMQKYKIGKSGRKSGKPKEE